MYNISVVGPVAEDNKDTNLRMLVLEILISSVEVHTDVDGFEIKQNISECRKNAMLGCAESISGEEMKRK